MSELYTVTAGAKPYAQDLNQAIDTLTGALDPGATTFAAPTPAPGAPSGPTLSAGSVTGTGYTWVAWWETGVLTGTGTARVNGTTPYGTATSATSMSSQQATFSAPASPPSTAIGWGLGRIQSGGTTYYTVSTAYLSAPGGSWPQITDDTPDASLSTLAPTANTTGTPVTLAGGATATPPLVGSVGMTVKGLSGQTADLQQWQDSSGTALAAVNATGQLASDLATGTAPLSITSTTDVANLNVAGLGGDHETVVGYLLLGFQNTTYGPLLTTSSTTATTTYDMVNSSNAYGGQPPQLYIASADADTSYYFEADLLTGTSGDAVYAELWDVTASASVGGSSVNTAGGWVVVRSAAITLAAGHQYTVALYSSTSGVSCYCAMARVVAKV